MAMLSDEKKETNITTIRVSKTLLNQLNKLKGEKWISLPMVLRVLVRTWYESKGNRPMKYDDMEKEDIIERKEKQPENTNFIEKNSQV